MLKTIALATALVTGASTLATAAPWPRVNVDADIYIKADRDRGDRYDRRDRERYNDYRRDLSPIGTELSGYQEIWIRGQRLRHIAIQPERGRPFIRQIAIDFEQGGPQVIKFDRRLRRGDLELIRVDNRPIKRIVVATGDARGSYSVFGS